MRDRQREIYESVVRDVSIDYEDIHSGDDLIDFTGICVRRLVSNVTHVWKREAAALYEKAGRALTEDSAKAELLSARADLIESLILRLEEGIRLDMKNDDT